MAREEIKKGVLISSIIVFFILFLLIGIYYFFSSRTSFCSDGTKNQECSIIKPYYCLNGNFIKNSSFCGCSLISKENEEGCISEYQNGEKELVLNYTLRGENKNISFKVYKGVYDYLLKVPRYIDSSKNPTLLDFKLKNLDEEFQEEFLFPLVVQIEDITKNKADQARIAISLVQNIPFGESVKSSSFKRINKVDYQRYAYEVLYDLEGVCSEKSGLLIFLLRKLGFGTAFIYYPLENHEVTGIKCPISNSLNQTGYCFIETTAPSIISDNKVEFVEIIELTSIPQIIPISDGFSFGNNMYEYADAKSFAKIRENIRQYGAINAFQSSKFKSLKKKYGLIDFYSYQF